MSSTTLAPVPTSLTMSALMLASPAFAADPPAKQAEGGSADAKPIDPQAAQLPGVTVQGDRERKLQSIKQTKSLLDTPQTATVIPAEVIKEQGASTLVQVLRSTPGISMQAGEGGTGGAPGDSLSIRGFNARKDIFIDGVRDFGSYSRDPFNLDQVEIVKGPSSALAGRGSTGGFVNLVTKQPQKDSFYAGTVSGGTDSYKRLTLDLNQSLDNGTEAYKGAALRINAVGFDADTPGRDYVTNRRKGINPTLTFGLGSPTQVSIGFFHLDQDNLPDFGIPFVPLANNNVPGVAGYGNQVAPVPYSNFYGLVNRDHENVYTNIGTLTVRHEFGNGVLLSNHTQYGLTYRDSIVSAPRFINATTTNINHELQTLDETDTSIVNQTDAVFKFSTDSVKHTVVTGVEIGYETSGNYAKGAYNPGTSPATSAPLAATAFPTTDLFHPDAFQPYSYSVLRTGAHTYTAARTQALYAFDTVDFDKRWSLTAGLRWDRFDAESESTSSIFTGNAVTDLGRVDKFLSWRAALSYKPAQNGNIYLAAGTSFNPSAEALTLANAANSLNSSNLGPEKSISYEVGTKWELDKLLLTAAVFQIDKTNARTEDPANPNDFITLNGEQRMRGVELGASGKLTPEWGVTAGYAYLNGRIISSANPLEVGQPMSSAPKNSASLWTTYAFASRWDIGGGVTYVGKRVVNTTNTRQVDGYTTLDAMAAYHVNGHFTVRLNAYNLTDKSYVLDMYNTGSSGHVIPGPGRSAVLSGEFAF
jgi:catecholate siderophore receptor